MAIARNPNRDQVRFAVKFRMLRRSEVVKMYISLGSGDRLGDRVLTIMLEGED